MKTHQPSALLSVENAMQQLLADVKPITDLEYVDYLASLGRVLAVAPVAQCHVPPADNSSMDGYAVFVDDMLSAKSRRLPVSQRICAGDTTAPLTPQTCARIFTGAEIPDGANAVVIQENVSLVDGEVVLPSGIPVGANIRKQGQDILAGSSILPVGHRLAPMDVGMLASANVTEVKVFRQPKVAIVSTGNELVSPGSVCDKGQIYNSNGALLTALLQKMGIHQVSRHHCPDSLDDTLQMLTAVAESADIVISTGGVSVGDEDHVKAALEILGDLAMWKIAIKPGKPLAYGHIGQTPFFGLPGNPASALVTFSLFVKPYLAALSGTNVVQPMSFKVPAGFSRTRSNSRQEYLRVRVEKGVLVAHENQSSGMLSSSSWASGLAVIAPNTLVADGDLIDYISFDALLN